LACAFVASAGLAHAQGTPADSAAVSDSTLVPAKAAATPAPARPAKNANGERARPWHATPTAIMFRSMLVPGWGQWVNHRPIKAVAALAVEGYAGVRLVQTWQEVDDALAARDEALAEGDQAAADEAQSDYDRAFNRRATAGWVLGLAIAVSMLDAYVDAHLIQFDADFGPDPALPPEARGAAGTGALDRALPGAAPTYRLSVRVPFTGP